MRSKVLLLLAVLVAAVVGYLAIGGDPLGLFGGRARSGAGGSSGDGLAGTGGGGADGSEEALLTSRRGPRLVGSERIARAGKGAVRGRALDVRTAKPVPNATLNLSGQGLSGETVAVSGLTAADGTFHLLGVPAGEAYLLRLEATGQPGRSVPGVDIQADGVTDLGDLWMGKASLVTGEVVDPSGQPVVGAEVALHRGIGSLEEFLRSGGFMDFFANLDREPEPLARTASKAGGAFRFEGVSPGPVSLLVRAPGFRQAIATLTLTGEGTAEHVKVRLAPGGTLAGRVVDAEGKGLEGAHLTAFAEEGGMPTPLARTFARTGPGGAFQFESLSGEGRHMLIATAPGYPNAMAHGDAGATDVRITLLKGATLQVTLLTDEKQTPIVGAQVLVSVGARAQMDDGPGSLVGALTDARGQATFEVRPGELQMVLASGSGFPPAIWVGQARGGMPGMMKGPEDPKVPTGLTRATFRIPRGVRVFGKVVDLEGRPLAGAEITSMAFIGRAGSAVSAADGSYELAVTAQFGMMVRAALPGYVQDRMDRLKGAERDTPGDGEGEDAPKERELNLVMRPAASVAGRVLGPDERPVAGASVSAVPVKERQGMDFDGMFAGPPSSITLADGTFLIDGVAAGGKVRLVARREGFVDGGSKPFDVGRDAVTTAADVHLLAGATQEVRVEGPDGQPLGGARVRAEVARSDGVEGGRMEDLMERSSGLHDHRTGPGGTVEIPLLPPGKLTLRVSAAGHAPGGARATIGADGGARAPIVVRLKAGITLEGIVLDADGKPVEGARVQVLNLEPAGPRPVPFAPSDSDDPPNEGTAEATASAPGGGAPSEEEWANEWDRSRRTTTDAKGEWRVADLPDRRYRLRATADGYRMNTQDLGSERRGIQLRLTAQPAAAKERIEAIDKELQSIYQRMGSAKGAEQQQLMERMQALQKERNDLNGN